MEESNAIAARNNDDCQFLELVSRYLDGQIAPAEAFQLNEQLRCTKARREAFVRFCLQGKFLAEVLAPQGESIGAESTLAAADLDKAGKSSLARIAPVAATQNPAAPVVKSPVLGFLGDVIGYVSNPRTVRFWLICAALVTYFTVQIGSVIISHFQAKNAQLAGGGAGSAARQPSVSSDRPDDSDPTTVARISSAVDCSWQIGAGGTVQVGGTSRTGAAARPEPVALPVGTDLRAGQQLDLLTGLAELTYASGAKVILHAPAHFAATALGGDLQLGRLTAKVPHTAAGFMVNTPSGKVVDLGTEFSVKVNDDRATEVIVFVGQVAVSSTGGGSSGGEATATVRVSAGHAIQVAPGGPIVAAASQEGGYVRDLDALNKKAAAASAYLEFVKQLKPALWLRMEGGETDRVVHDEVSGRDFKLNWDGPGNPFVKGRVGKALWLRGDKLKDYALVPEYPQAENGRLSFAAWIYAHDIAPWASIAKNWSDEHHGQFHVGAHPAEKGGGADLLVQVLNKKGEVVPVREGASHPLPVNEWQHVAFVADGSKLHLYRNGREVANAECAGVCFPVTMPALGIGVKLDGSGKAVSDYNGYWDGLLDEVVIVNDALTPEQIRTLAGADK